MAFSDVVARLHGRSRATEHPVSTFPRSLVKILDEAELDLAVERAAAFEQDVAVHTAGRIARYQEMTRRGQLIELPIAADSSSVASGRAQPAG